MKFTLLLSFFLTVPSFSYPELCMPDHRDEYTGAYAEAKTGIDKFWKDSGLTCNEVGDFLDYFELKEPLPGTATEKEKCVWAGTVQGIALFSHQREQECGVKRCKRMGNYIGRNVAKSFCGLVELYTSDLNDKFLKDLERPVCSVGEAECVNEAEIYAGGVCKGLKEKYATIWQTILRTTCR
jgi:hypothetical protein